MESLDAPFTGEAATGHQVEELEQRGVWLTATFELVRYLGVMGDAHGSGTKPMADFIVAATDVDGSPWVWERRRVVWPHPAPPRPGQWVDVAYLPEDRSVRTSRYGASLTNHSSPARGWGAGDFTPRLEWLAEEREAFRAGTKVLADVKAAKEHTLTNRHDAWRNELTLVVAGVEHTIERWLSSCCDVRAGHQLLVVQSPAGEIVALDTDETYVGQYGQCLALSREKAAAAQALASSLGAYDAGEFGDKHAAGRALVEQELAGLDRVHGLSDAMRAVAVQHALDDAFERGGLDDATYSGILAEHTGVHATHAEMLARSGRDPRAGQLSMLDNLLRVAAKEHTRRFLKSSDETYATTVRGLLDGALSRGTIDAAEHARRLAEAGLPPASA